MKNSSKFQNVVIATIVGWLVLFVFLPNLMIIATSFLTRDDAHFVKLVFTLDNYTRLLDPLYFEVLLHSLNMALIATLACLVLGYPFAWFLAKLPHKVRPLLLFLLIATTLINPNALKLMLPKSSNQLKDKAMTTVSIQDAGHGKYRYYVELQEVGSIEGVERALKTRLDGQKDATVSLHCDETVAVGETVKVMNIAKDNNYKLILATAPN